MGNKEGIEVGDTVELLISPNGRGRGVFAEVKEVKEIECKVCIHTEEYPWMDGDEKCLPYSLVRKADSE